VVELVFACEAVAAQARDDDPGHPGPVLLDRPIPSA
jgi:hypothetical protein